MGASAAEREALAWLFSLADQERGVGWNPRANPDTQWNLGRTRALLDLDGAPDHQLRVVLVAGTKGKGSTCALLASILGAAGVRGGLYTKPHLQTYRERVRVDGQAISAATFLEATRRLQALTAELARVHPDAGEPTTFEVTTALALDVFARGGCQVAVVEVGLGGRLDATNALDPEISVITSISYDHTAILGRTLAAIATEKAGILRPGRLALVAVQRPTAQRALRRVARRIGAHWQIVPPLDDVPIALHGAHQQQNAALAVAVARALLPNLSEQAITQGLQRLHWPGRFEIIPGQPEVILDGAHNDASAAALARTLADYAGHRPLYLVVGINRDKDAAAVLRPLLPLATTVYATQTADNPRALAAASLAQRCQRLGVHAAVLPELSQALQQACADAAASENSLVCITGSLLLVGQARATLGVEAPESLW